MLTKDLQRLARIADEIEMTLGNPLKQSMQFWRGDLRALMKAAREAQNRNWYSQQFKSVIKSTKEMTAAARQTNPPPRHRSAR